MVLSLLSKKHNNFPITTRLLRSIRSLYISPITNSIFKRRRKNDQETGNIKSKEYII